MIFNKAIFLFKKIIKKALSKLYKYVHHNKILRNIAEKILGMFPKTRSYLKRILIIDITESRKRNNTNKLSHDALNIYIQLECIKKLLKSRE